MNLSLSSAFFQLLTLFTESLLFDSPAQDDEEGTFI